MYIDFERILIIINHLLIWLLNFFPTIVTFIFHFFFFWLFINWTTFLRTTLITSIFSHSPIKLLLRLSVFYKSWFPFSLEHKLLKINISFGMGCWIWRFSIFYHFFDLILWRRMRGSITANLNFNCLFSIWYS